MSTTKRGSLRGFSTPMEPSSLKAKPKPRTNARIRKTMKMKYRMKAMEKRRTLLGNI